MANPDALPVHEVSALLRDEEALVIFFDTPQLNPTPEETFIWVVTKTDMRLARSDLGSAALTREVQALRCGLDHTAWVAPGCKNVTGQDYRPYDFYAGKPLPFSLERAYELYTALFSQVEDLIKGKSLLIVPSGPLTQLPFQVLVTAEPKNEDYRAGDLVHPRPCAHGTTCGFLAQGATPRGRPSAAKKPLMGFGNPLLEGNHGDHATDRTV